MEPNFHNREYLLVNQMSYRIRAPQRGEVIIFKFPLNPKEDYIKRIIGLPGETIKVENGNVYINNTILPEDYLSPDQKTTSTQDQEGITLNKNEYYVMGDNRDNSSDSRTWGILPKKNIIGRAWLIMYPWSNRGLVKNPEYTQLQFPSQLESFKSYSFWIKFLTSSSATWLKKS